MEEQDIIAIIMSRLRVEVESTSEYGYGGEADSYITVRLIMNDGFSDKCVSSSSVRIDT